MDKRLILLLIIAFGLSSGCSFKGYHRDFSKKAEFSSGGTLKIEGADGDIKIKSWNRDSIRINGTKHLRVIKFFGSDWFNGSEGYVNDVFDRTKIEFEQENNVVEIEVIEPSVSSGGIQVDMEIWIPGNANIEVNCDDGDVDIEKIVGNVSIESDDGDIDLSMVEGPFSINTDDGDIELNKVMGEGEVITEDGDIELHDFNGNIEMETEDGDINVKNSREELVCRTEDGDLIIRDHKGSIYTITEDGDIEILDIEGDVRAESDDGWIECRIREFKVPSEIHLESIDGEIELEIPEHPELSIYASSYKNNDIDSDFSLVESESQLEGKIKVKIITEGEDIKIRKKEK